MTHYHVASGVSGFPLDAPAGLDRLRDKAHAAEILADSEYLGRYPEHADLVARLLDPVTRDYAIGWQFSEFWTSGGMTVCVWECGETDPDNC